MDIKHLSDSEHKSKFDPLFLYHQSTYFFDSKLQNLLSILDMPKEYKLEERFKSLESILDTIFRLDLIHHLQLIKVEMS